MQATRTRPKLTVSCDGSGVVAHAGTRLLADLAYITRLTNAFGGALLGYGAGTAATTRAGSRSTWR